MHVHDSTGKWENCDTKIYFGWTAEVFFDNLRNIESDLIQ